MICQRPAPYLQQEKAHAHEEEEEGGEESEEGNGGFLRDYASRRLKLV